MVQKLHFCEKVYFYRFCIFKYSFYHSFTLYYCAIVYSLDAGFFSIPSGCQAVWTLIRPDILFAKVISRHQKLPLADKELNTKQLVDTTFWLKPWLKLTSFGSNVFHLSKVLATTVSLVSISFERYRYNRQDCVIKVRSCIKLDFIQVQDYI